MHLQPYAVTEDGDRPEKRQSCAEHGLQYVVLQRHVDCTHFNPLKHALLERIEDWPWSTYHRYVREGLYAGPAPFKNAAKSNTPDFGE